MTAKKTEGAESAEPKYDIDDLLAKTDELQRQVSAMENFANVLAGQRNEAQNTVAQLTTRLQEALQQLQAYEEQANAR